MKHILRFVIILLLSINGISAIYGGLHLIFHPDGSSLGLTPEWLIDSPFTDFFIPGIVLFAGIGLCSLAVLYFFLKNAAKRGNLVIWQGIFLYLYILAQVIMLNILVPLHAIYGGLSIVMIFSGWIFNKLYGKNRPQ